MVIRVQSKTSSAGPASAEQYGQRESFGDGRRPLAAQLEDAFDDLLQRDGERLFERLAGLLVETPAYPHLAHGAGARDLERDEARRVLPLDIVLLQAGER